MHEETHTDNQPRSPDIDSAGRALADALLGATAPDSGPEQADLVSESTGLRPISRRRRTPKRLLLLDLSLAVPRAVEVERAAGNRYQSVSSFTLPFGPPEGHVHDPTFLTSLHDQIIKNDVDARHVVVILPDTIIHHRCTTFPPLGRHALRSVVRQKARQIDQLTEAEPVLGMRTVRRGGAAGGIESLWAAANRHDMLMACRGLREIGLDPIAFYPCVAGLHQVYQALSSPGRDGCVALAQVCSGEARFILTEGNTVYYDRAVRMESDATDDNRLTLIRQVHRTLLHHIQQRPDRPLTRVILLDDDPSRAEWLASDFARELLVPVEIARPGQAAPAAEEADWGGSATLAGALHLFASRDANAMNMLPREVRTRRRSTAFALGSTLLAAATLLAAWTAREKLIDANARTRSLLALTNKAISSLGEVQERHAAMDAMLAETRQRIDCLQENELVNLRAPAMLSTLATATPAQVSVDAVRLQARTPLAARGREGMTVEVEIEGRCHADFLEAQRLIGTMIRKLEISGQLRDLQSEPLRAPRGNRTQDAIPFVLTGRVSGR